MGGTGFAERQSAAPAQVDWSSAAFDAEADVAVVGGGGGGLPTALFARWHGDDVILLEKAPELGGTALKAAFWYWVPNNAPMRELGIEDPEEDFLRYVARLSRPDRYDPGSPTLGLSPWEHALCRAIYDSASPAAELLAERGALPPVLTRSSVVGSERSKVLFDEAYREHARRLARAIGQRGGG